MNIANSVLLQQLQFCSDRKFTGKLSINNIQGHSIDSMNGECWTLIFSRGKLVGNIAGIHPRRSLRRQFEKQNLTLSPILEQELNESIQTPDLVYWLLEKLPQKTTINRDQVLKIIQGSLLEALLDILRHEILSDTSDAQPLTYLLEAYKFSNDFVPIIPTRIESIWSEVSEHIKNWKKKGLMQWSPHLAPQITDFFDLKKVLLTEKNRRIVNLANGERTIWDIAVQVSEDVSIVGHLLLKCYQQEAIVLKSISDFHDQDQRQINILVQDFLTNIDTSSTGSLKLSR